MDLGVAHIDPCGSIATGSVGQCHSYFKDRQFMWLDGSGSQVGAISQDGYE